MIGHNIVGSGDQRERKVLSARERAYDGIRASILKGAFTPGGFIEEAMACELTGVSRTPVAGAQNKP